MIFSITPDKLQKLEDQLIASHQVVMSQLAASPTGDAHGVMQSIDGKIEADFTYIASTNTLGVELTKHDGYPSWIANAGLKSKLEAAIKSL
jgi:hypothetical protein